MSTFRLLLSLLFCTPLLSACQDSRPAESLLPAEAFAQALEKQPGQVIDVRTPEEYAQGHLPQAQLLNFYDQDFETRIAQLDPKVQYYVYCKSGGRSAKAHEIMQAKGLKVVELAGGFDAWKSTALPQE